MRAVFREEVQPTIELAVAGILVPPGVNHGSTNQREPYGPRRSK